MFSPLFNFCQFEHNVILHKVKIIPKGAHGSIRVRLRSSREQRGSVRCGVAQLGLSVTQYGCGVAQSGAVWLNKDAEWLNQGTA
jgi:hypothetical protein